MNWYTEVFNKLNEVKISYAVVGGLAVSLHGATRGTIDLDLVISLDLQSLENFEKQMKSLGLVSRIPINAKDLFQFRKEYMEKRNLVAWTFQHPVQAHQVIDLIITHDFRNMKKVNKNVLGTQVPVLALPDLIKMKKEAGRPQDLEDIKALQEIKKS